MTTVARDFSSLAHKIVDHRLVICRALENHGKYYDISIGVEGQSFDSAIPRPLDARIQILVEGCLESLQHQLAAQQNSVQNLEQLGFVVQKQPDNSYVSHALVAAVGQTALDHIKAGNYSSMYFGDTTQMFWRPEKANEVTWVGGRKQNYSVHDGLVQLCSDLSSDFQIFNFRPEPVSSSLVPATPAVSAPMRSSGLRTARPHNRMQADTAAQSPREVLRDDRQEHGDPVSPLPPPVDQTQVPSVLQPGSLAHPVREIHPEGECRRDHADSVSPHPEPAPAEQREPEPAVQKKQEPFQVRRRSASLASLQHAAQLAEETYSAWQKQQGQKELWDKISWDHLRGIKAIENADDRHRVENAIQSGSEKIRQLFAAMHSIADRYFRAELNVPAGTYAPCGERASQFIGNLDSFYHNFIETTVIAPIKRHWNARW